MEHNYDDIVLLERYIDGSLTPEEGQLVERRLAEEPGLKELYQNERLLVNGIRYSHLKSKLGELQQLEASLPSIIAEEAKVIPLTNWRVLAAAASIAIVIGAFFFLNRPIAPDELYAQYFQPYPNIIESIKRGTVEQNQRADAFAAYEKGDYATAVKGFDVLLKAKDEPGVRLLLGNANLMLNHNQEALDNFITLSKDSDFRRPANWYRSLCYLKIGKKEAAKVLLEEMAAEESSYQVKARELLKKLD